MKRLLLPLALWLSFILSFISSGTRAQTLKDNAMIPSAWLQKQISVEEAEIQNPGIKGDRTAGSPEIWKPFGFQSKEWTALKAELKTGDQIWTFISPADSWKSLAGRAGIALVRNGEAIRTIVTIMN